MPNDSAQRSLREIVYEELKHKILIGEYPSLTRLMEIDLAEKMNVSRTPIREAIRKLENDGLVVIEPRKGAYVSKISTSRILEVLEIRKELEGLAAELAAKRINEEDALTLSKLCRLYEIALGKNDRDKIVEHDENLHKHIVKCSGNNTLIQMVNQLQDLSMRFRYLYYDDYADDVNMLDPHRAIKDAIIQGQPELARQEARKHIEDLKNFVKRMSKTRFQGFTD